MLKWWQFYQWITFSHERKNIEGTKGVSRWKRYSTPDRLYWESKLGLLAWIVGLVRNVALTWQTIQSPSKCSFPLRKKGGKKSFFWALYQKDTWVRSNSFLVMSGMFYYSCHVMGFTALPREQNLVALFPLVLFVCFYLSFKRRQGLPAITVM